MPPIKASEFDGDFSEFLHQYKYQPMLTRKLDGLGDGSLTPELINEIVLWKVDRYVSVDGGATTPSRRPATAEAGRARTSTFSP